MERPGKKEDAGAVMLAIWHIVNAVRVAVTYWVLKRVIQDIARDVEKWYTENIPGPAWGKQ